MLLEKDRGTSAGGFSPRQVGLTPAPGCCEGLVLAELGECNLAFSEANQAIYEINDPAFYVWGSLEAGMSAAAVVRELMVAGVDLNQAQRDVGRAMAERARLASPAACSPSLASQPDRVTHLSIVIADVVVHLHLSKTLVSDVVQAFGTLKSDSPTADIVLCAIAAGDTVTVFSPGQLDWSCNRSQFIPLFKANLIECVLQRSRYEVALHAAAVARGKGVMLLMGSPGAGKTTLAIALNKSGLEVLADDVVLLDERGLVSGVSLPFTAKSSSWHLLSHRWPGIVTHPSHCRPDGQTLCYIPLDCVLDPRPRKIDVVVILNRQDNTRTCIEELDLVCALVALVEEGATRDERLSASGFSALVGGLREARCCRLTYSDLGEAAVALCSFDS